jgi:DNA-binding NarL/FixJ family response regulator
MGQAPADRDDDAVVPVLLIDDHRAFTDALRISLERQPDLRCVAVAHSAHEGLAQAANTDFAVAIVDLGLPDAGGLELIATLLGIRPHARIVVLTAHPRPDLAERALSAGATGFLGKDTTLERILTAVRTSGPGHPIVETPTESAGAVALTHREHEVLRHLGCGFDATRIADELGISLHTTRGHIKTVMAKLGARSQLGAVVTAEQRGLITLGSRY